MCYGYPHFANQKQEICKSYFKKPEIPSAIIHLQFLYANNASKSQNRKIHLIISKYFKTLTRGIYLVHKWCVRLQNFICRIKFK